MLSSLLQGGYTRRPSVASAPLSLSHRGVLSTSVGLLLLSLLPFLDQSSSGGALLWAGAACLAFASASVVNGLNAGASLLCSDADADGGEGDLPKGKTMGQFRSAGQLGRALGPIFGTLPAPSFRPSPAKSPSLTVSSVSSAKPARVTGCWALRFATPSTAWR